MEYLIGLIAGIVGTGIAARAWLFLGYRYYKRGQRHFEQANEQIEECYKLNYRTEYAFERDLDVLDEIAGVREEIEAAMNGRK